jgi:hypothetical protein
MPSEVGVESTPDALAKYEDTTGIGTGPSEMKASRLLPQPRPSALYICTPPSGKRAPNSERSTASAAVAEAA